MKRFLCFFLFCVGCSKTSLSCTSVDYSSFMGSKNVSDVLVFKDDNLVQFNRNIKFSVNSNLSKKMVYKYLKNEGKVFKRFVGGKYSVSFDGDVVVLNIKSRKISDDDVTFLSFNSRDYEDIKSSYSELGFSCK